MFRAFTVEQLDGSLSAEPCGHCGGAVTVVQRTHVHVWTWPIAPETCRSASSQAMDRVYAFVQVTEIESGAGAILPHLSGALGVATVTAYLMLR